MNLYGKLQLVRENQPDSLGPDAEFIKTVDISRRPGPHTCHKCKLLIEDGDGKEFINYPNDEPFLATWFHDKCFNRYEHYYGLDKPVD